MSVVKTKKRTRTGPSKSKPKRGSPLSGERKLVNNALINHLRGSPGEKMLALEAITDFINLRAREDGYHLPLKNCPVAQDEKVVATVAGIPLYECDFRTDADMRETVFRRVRLYGEKLSPAVTALRYPGTITDGDYKAITQFMVDHLNAMLKLDPKAITAFMDALFPCNIKLSEEVVLGTRKDAFTSLGLINGLIGHGRWRVVAVCDDTSKSIIKFDLGKV